MLVDTGPYDVPQLDSGGDPLRGRVRADPAAGAGQGAAIQERRDLHSADRARQLQVLSPIKTGQLLPLEYKL